MSSLPPDRSDASADVPPSGFWDSPLRSRLALTAGAVVLMLLLLWWWRPLLLIPGTQPLVMSGGDPYLRALMRTISASESNVLRPYHVMYGHDYVWTLDVHPNRCESIGQGPNRGNCSTAAGRYQLLYSTWLELAARYHPQRTDDPLDATGLSFAPEYQDLVVHAWLSEGRWGNLSTQLRQGRVQPVLRRLSGTWTSLGYGIETNSMSRQLPRIYQQVLKEELARAGKDAAEPGTEKQKGRTAETVRP
ncbi:glycoside hydrolase family protein [Hydrogenophaga sp.]|uniref:glycoside hydrolase family 24 protein n=1 Tax=Hydrogenophaga sp. TaxID=1904254 RepID=UPI000A76C2FF|nr:glycoside hydrolase family protein [Hydrogenophaga sp.]